MANLWVILSHARGWRTDWPKPARWLFQNTVIYQTLRGIQVVRPVHKDCWIRFCVSPYLKEGKVMRTHESRKPVERNERRSAAWGKRRSEERRVGKECRYRW